METLRTFAICTVALLLSSCSHMRQGVGLRGIAVDDERMTLDGDTFTVKERISDSLLVVSKDAYADGAPDYLLKKESNGFYYVQAEADGISSIYDTSDFVLFGNGDVFGIREKEVLFCAACCLDYGLSYLGKGDGKYLFSNTDSICFSNGEYIGLRKDVSCATNKDNSRIRLTLGAQSVEVSPKELCQYLGKTVDKDETVLNIKKSYFITPRNEHETDEAGFDIDLEIPKGNTAVDVAIREWIVTQVRNDIFPLLKYDPEEIPVAKCDSIEEMKGCLDRYGEIWEKLLRHDYQDGDTLCVRISSHIVTRKVVDCEDYATYYFSSLPYSGGMHELPRSYYVTYDKRRNGFLTAGEMIKRGKEDDFRMAVLRRLKKMRDERYEETSQWEDFTRAVFSSSAPSEESEGSVDEIIDMLYSNLYYCDKAAEWKNKNSAYTEQDFPLPHFAIIPEGVVLTYHPYQIDCFAAGEYHAVMPFKEIAGCLRLDYKEEARPHRLDWFLRTERE